MEKCIYAIFFKNIQTFELLGAISQENRLIQIDGDTVQVQRMEYRRCQTDVDVHVVRIGIASVDKAG